MVSTLLSIELPLNPYNFTTPEHQDFSRFPNPITAHDSSFRENLLKTRRTLGEQVLADIFEIAFADLWVIDQCPVHNRFPDFFIPAFNLAVEVDGGYHYKGGSRDRRDGYKDWALTKRGFNVFHIDNRFLVESCLDVVSELKKFVERLLEPIQSFGPFCPWGWTHYLAYKSSEKNDFSLSNPNDLVSIRWEIKKRYPVPEYCPSKWRVAEREKAFEIEANTLDLTGLNYELDPGSFGDFLYPRCDKFRSDSNQSVKAEKNRSITSIIFEELGRLSDKNPSSISLTDSLVGDLGLGKNRINDIRVALGDAFNTHISYQDVKYSNYVSDLVRYFWFTKYE
jgi:very-short-patch-repair endonuclease